MVRRLLVAVGVVLLAMWAFAGTEPKTTITEPVTNRLNAAAVSASVTCTLSGGGTWDDGGTPVSVTSPVTGSTDGDGTLSLELTPNDLITPADTYWVCDWYDSSGKWRETRLVPSDVDPIAWDSLPGVQLAPDEHLRVYGDVLNMSPEQYGLPVDTNGDGSWDVKLWDDGDSGVILRNGYGFIQYGIASQLRIKLCGGTIVWFMFDEDGDGTDDGADDYCFGPAVDDDCDCTANATGAGDMTKVVYDNDDDGTVDKADALGANGSNCSSGQAALGVDAAGAAEGCWTPTGSSPAGFSLDGTANWYTFSADEDGTNDVALFDPRTVDSDGDGTADLDITAGGLGGLHGDGSNVQRMAIFPGGYTADPFDYASGYVFENNSATGYGSFYPVVSDPNYGALSSPPYVDLGTSTYKWRDGFFGRDGYFGRDLYSGKSTFKDAIFTSTETSGYTWSTVGTQRWVTDSDFSSAAERTFTWSTLTDDNTDGTYESRDIMHLARSSNPRFFVDIIGSGNYALDIFSNSKYIKLDADSDGTAEFTIDGSAEQFCLDPDDNANCDFIFKDYGTDIAPVVGIAFHGATVPTIVHDDNSKLLKFDLDEDATPEMTIDGSAFQVTLDPNSDGTADMLLNQTFLQTDQVRYSSTDASRMTATNGRMHMCGGNQFAPNAAAGACIALGGSTGTYATTIYFDPDGDGTSESTIDGTGNFTGKASTAGALSTDPTGCTSQFVTDMAAAGALTCNSVTGGYVTDGSLLAADLSWDSTATRTAGQYVTVGTDTTKFLATTRTEVLTFTGATAVCNADPPLVKLPAASTITKIHCAVWAATSIPLSVEECDANIGSCAGVDGATSITCDTDGATDDGSLSNASIDANDWIKLNFGSATGTIVGATVTIYYTTP